MELNNYILFFFLFLFTLFFYKYFPSIIYKFNSNILIDNEYKKPQAFHEYSISTSGGLGIFFSFLIVFFYFLFFKQIIYFEYLSFCTLFFLLGLLDDLKLNIRPKFRLILMIFFLVSLVIFNKFYVEK